jgi:formylglycine-generating enzyme required for sulfatase activity
MTPFNPYHKWLGIPETERPISKYRLLALVDFEVDREVISTAAERQTVFLRTLQAGEHELLVAQLLNEVSQARVTLLNADQKAAYDEELRKQQTPEPVPEPAPVPIPVVQTPTPTPVVVRGTVTQEFPVSVVQPANRPRRRRQQEIWKRPAVIGAAVVGVIGVFVLVISLMSSGDAKPVASNTAGRNSAEMAVEKAAADKAAMDKAAADKAAMDKAAADKAAMDKAAMEKAAADKAAADKAAADKAAADKVAAVKSALAKGNWKAVLALDPGNKDGLRMQAAAEKAAAEKAAIEKAAADKAAILAGDPITNTIGMTFNNIPAGTFTMGSPESEADREDDETQHKVTIGKAFYMQTTEVTQGQWKAVMSTEPWNRFAYFKEGPNYAVSNVNWKYAVEYCKKLSEQEGKTYRLPTEAEWEYACRAGTETRWSFGNDEKDLGDYAWYDKNAYGIGERYPHQVGLKKPNAFGLYDMHGNVWEWCHDYYVKDYYQQSPGKDPTGPAQGSFRVLRGGSWDRSSRSTRSADRSIRNGFPNNVGFRLVRELD